MTPPMHAIIQMNNPFLSISMATAESHLAPLMQVIPSTNAILRNPLAAVA